MDACVTTGMMQSTLCIHSAKDALWAACDATIVMFTSCYAVPQLAVWDLWQPLHRSAEQYGTTGLMSAATRLDESWVTVCCGTDNGAAVCSRSGQPGMHANLLVASLLGQA